MVQRCKKVDKPKNMIKIIIRSLKINKGENVC